MSKNKLFMTYVLIALLCASFWSMLAAVGLIPAVAKFTGLHYTAEVVPATFGVALGGTLWMLLAIGGAHQDNRRPE